MKTHCLQACPAGSFSFMFITYESPLGIIVIESDGECITGLSFDDHPDVESTMTNIPVLKEACRWLDVYFDGRDPGATPPIKTKGTPFQERIWHMLSQIPYGTTVTYGSIAKKISREDGRKMSAQAVGNAVGKNPIVIMVPCHRVIGSDGDLTGYAFGIGRKRCLLSLEGIDI